MSVIPQSFRLTTGDGKMYTPPVSYYPAPGEYETHTLQSMTRKQPHYPQITSPLKTSRHFGTAPQRPDHNNTTILLADHTKDSHKDGKDGNQKDGTPTKQKIIHKHQPPGPGSYDIAIPLGSDLPGVTKDYHDEYLHIARAMVDGRRQIGLEHPGIVELSKSQKGEFLQ